MLLTASSLLATTSPLVQPAAESSRVPVVDTGGLETQWAALVLSGQEGGDLPLSLLPSIGRVADGDGRHDVYLVVDLDGRSLLEGLGHEPHLLVEFYAYLLDSRGGVAAFLTRAFAVDLEEHGARLATSGVKVFGRLKAPPGSYSLRLLVLAQQTERFRLQVLPLEVSAGRDLELVVPEPAEEWLVAASPEDLAPGLPLTQLLDAARRWLPATRPVLETATTRPILISGEPSRPLVAELLDVEDKVVAEAPVELRGPAVSGSQSPRALRSGHLQVPPVPAGTYRLRLRDASGKTTLPLPAILLPKPDGVDRAELRLQVWPHLRGNRASGPATPGPLSDHAREKGHSSIRFDPSRLLASGIEALSVLATGDLEGAGGRLEALTAGRLREGSNKDQAKLIASMSFLFEELAAIDPDSLLPILAAFESLYRDQHRRQSFLLSTHSRRFVAQLGELYVKSGKGEKPRHLAACAWASLGGYWQEIGSVAEAERAFEQAHDYDRRLPAALLGLATLAEGRGDYETAVRHLEDLVRVRPDSDEAALRLAVNRRRRGDLRPAIARLESILERPGPSWVRAVAYQELAVALVERGRAEQAIARLERGMAELPDVPRLAIQLAALLDGAGEPQRALQTLGRVELAGHRDRPSPRLLYSRVPSWAVDEARTTLRRAAETAGFALGAALEQI